MDKSPLQQLNDRDLPRMVKWYDPRLLARVGLRTLVSNVFGQYADQRLIQAASDQIDDAKLRQRYDFCDTDAVEWRNRISVEGETGAFWIDYIADVGDGFDSTYTMAYLLAQDELVAKEAKEPLKHGDILILGGDQCYPQATRVDYRKRLQTPYEWAFDVPRAERKLFAIPGNHDWYDGLAAFDSLFCASRDRLSNGLGTRIGGWQCLQHRSYWALRLPHRWWIWGTDIQFSKYLDVSQVNYFRTIAEQMDENDKLIICMAQPNWLMADFSGTDQEENFFKITTIARDRGVRVFAVVAGDWHHYAHYFAHDLGVHFITSGGGGAFLHPTHILKDNISVTWPERKTWDGTSGEPSVTGEAARWEAQQVDIRLKNQRKSGDNAVRQAVRDVLAPIRRTVRSGASAPLRPMAPKVYPDKGTSWALSFKNVAFPFYNFSFAMGIGLVYWLITWQFHTVAKQYGISGGKIDQVGIGETYGAVLTKMPIYLLNATLSLGFTAMLIAMFGVVIWYVDAVDFPRWRRLLVKITVGTLHFAVHAVAMFALFLAFHSFNNQLSPAVETQLERIAKRYQQDEGWLPKVVVEETLEPLSRRSYEQRQSVDPTLAGPRSLQAPAPAAPAEPGKVVDPRPVRELVGLLYPFEMILIGGFVGGFIWGMYWVLAGFLGRMHAEDAFAALRIKDYKNFLRMKFEPDRVTIFPIGLDNIPPKSNWRNRRKEDQLSSNSLLVATKPIPYHLIEAPIVIEADNVKSAKQ